MRELLDRLQEHGAALALADSGALRLLSNAQLDADIIEELRQQKPALLLRLQAEREAHLHLFAAEARRFVGSASCDAGELHRLYLAQVQATYGGDVLRSEGASLDAFTEALQAAAAPAPPAALDASFEEEHGERAAVMQYEGGLSRACADAWSRELKHLEEHGRKLARAPVSCRLAVGVSFVDASYQAGAPVVVLPAGAPLDAISQDDAEWLRGRLERLHKLRRDSQHGEQEAKASARARLQAEEAFVLVKLGGVLRLVERGRLALQGDETPRTMEGAAAA